MSYLSNWGYFGICPAEFHTAGLWKVTLKWGDCGLLSLLRAGILRLPCLPFEPFLYFRDTGGTWSVVHSPAPCSVSKPELVLIFTPCLVPMCFCLH